jgi:hypothetical protein
LRGPDPPIRIRETGGVNLKHACERRAPQRPAASIDERIGRAYAAQLVHQGQRRRTAHGEASTSVTGSAKPAR